MDLKFNKDAGFAFLCIFGVTLLSYGQIFLPGYTPDDFLSGSAQLPPALYFAQGRFVEAILVSILNTSHLSMFGVGFGFSGLVLLLYAGLIVVLLQNCVPARFDRRLVLAAGMSVAASPLVATLLSYRQTAFNLAACLLLLLYGIRCYQDFLRQPEVWGRAIPAVVCFAFSLGCYQIFISVIVLYFGCLSLCAVFENRRIPLGNLVVPLASVALYCVIFALTRNIAGENHWDDRRALLPLSAFGQRALEIRASLANVAGARHGLGLLALVALVPVGVQCAVSFRVYPKLTVLTVAVAACLCAVILFPAVGLTRWEPTPRMFLGCSFVVAFGVVWLCGLSGLFTRAGMVGLALFSMMVSNMFLTEQIKENRWDMAMATTLVVDVRTALGGRAPSTLFVVTDPVAHGHSSFRVGWSIPGILHEAANADWTVGQPTADMQQTCRTSPAFPLKGYLHILPNGGVLACL